MKKRAATRRKAPGLAELTRQAVAIARGAGRIVRRDFARPPGKVGTKSTLIDLVTSTDHESEAYVIRSIEKLYPDHAILSEEAGTAGRDGPMRWVVDPLDGTVNFAHRIPHFCVLVAVQERTATGFSTLVGVTLDPIRDELFVAVRGGGATKNGKRIAVSNTGRLIDSVSTTGFAYDRLFKDDNNHAEFCRMNLLTRGTRRLGSAGLDFAYVACGRIDLFWETTLNPWDIAAGALLVEEAGGTVTNMRGGPQTGMDVLVTNGILHVPGLAALHSARDYPVASRQGLAPHLPDEVAAKVGA